MSSPGIDKWIEEAPESWAKLADTKKGKKKLGYNNWKKKFLEGAKNENKDYLEKYLTDQQLKKIYTNGYGGTTKTTTTTTIQPTKPTTITVTRKTKTYTRTNTKNWGNQEQYVLQLAAKTKPTSQEYNKYVNILMNTGRTRQATTKKIQRTRKGLK
ncbi:MAG: hypothetical protein WCI04_05105 [archaeon]